MSCTLKPSCDLYAVVGGSVVNEDPSAGRLYMRTFRVFWGSPDVAESMVEITEQKLENRKSWSNPALADAPKQVHIIKFHPNGMNPDDCFWYDADEKIVSHMELAIPRYIVYGVYDYGDQDIRSICIFETYKTAKRYMKHLMSYGLFQYACLETLDHSARRCERVGFIANSSSNSMEVDDESPAVESMPPQQEIEIIFQNMTI